MSRTDIQRLDDILEAADAIGSHLSRGALEDGLVFDAVCMRLIQIGEAAKWLTPETTAREPGVPWRQVAGMRDRLAHRYHDALTVLVQATVDDELPVLRAATARLRAGLAGAAPS
ncbi:MAG: DUF86 domain-containing protein [Bifidobacteriaceae bacterium]|nr:DUF86 domain-containing protein [Bifidobacteriaceae bacterium]